MSPRKDTRKSAEITATIDAQSKGFTDEERAAMEERAEELNPLVAPASKVEQQPE